jgi:hypothetical protein
MICCSKAIAGIQRKKGRIVQQAEGIGGKQVATDDTDENRSDSFAIC